MAENNVNLNMSRINPKEIDNSALVEAIRDMRKEFTPEKQNKVINLALRATFFVPAVVGKNTELVEGKDHKVKFEDKQTAKFLLITNSQKAAYFPAFTGTEEVKTFKTEQPFQAFAMKFSDLANLTERTPTVNGFVINPNEDNLPFTKEMLANIKKILIETTQKRKAEAEAEAAGRPNIEVSTNPDPEQ